MDGELFVFSPGREWTEGNSSETRFLDFRRMDSFAALSDLRMDSVLWVVCELPVSSIRLLEVE